MAKVWVLQHAACERLGTIAEALGRAGVEARYVRAFEGEAVPRETEGAEGLVVMGGPMGVYEAERYPYLSDEMRLIERAVREEKPVLGVCLGSQLLAAALGARVRKGRQKEIGWHRVTLTAEAARDGLWSGVESSFMAYHWHGDVFELPRGAVGLARSDLTECQAFRYGSHAYGFLFHMEVSEGQIGEMVATFTDEMREAGVEEHEMVGKTGEHLPGLERIGGVVFGRWAGVVAKREG